MLWLGPLAAAGMLALVLTAAGVPAAWALLGLCAAATLPIAGWGLATGRFLEPLPVLAVAGALLFVLRPLQLFVDWPDLYSYFAPLDPVDRLVLLDGQEVARFVGERLQEPLDTALARASGACAMFLVLLALGYRLGLGERLAGRLSRLRGARAPNLVPAIALSLLIGLGAQLAIVVRVGGPAGSFERASEQAALSESFPLFVLAGFGTAGLIVWAAWLRPRSASAWAAFVTALVAVSGFSVAAGSRSRVFVALLALAVIVHYLWRPFRRREVAAAVLLFLAFVSSFVVFREVAEKRSLREAAGTAPAHVLDARVIANDITSYDHVLYATTIFGRSREHERGAFLAGSVRSFVPRAIDSGKPEGGDIVFRRAVWGEQVSAGRPPTAVGDLFIDLGFPGVAVGALVIGLAARSLLGLAGGAGTGRPYRVALYAIGLVMLYTLVVDTSSLALGYAFTLALPFFVAVHVFARLPGGWRPGSIGPAA